MPETRYEVIDGRVVYVPPADEPHGTRQAKLAALLEAHAADTHEVACEMLTRTSAKGDMAPDASVFPAARDAATGGRQLEELAFEVVSTQRLSHAAKKARALAGRGVRRIIAIQIDRRRVLSWSPAADDWEELPSDGTIADPSLSVPLPVRTLVHAARADDAVAAALIARKNPVIEGALKAREAQGEARGQLEGKLAALLAMLSVRGLHASPETERRLRSLATDAGLDAWIRRAVTVNSIDDLLEDP